MSKFFILFSLLLISFSSASDTCPYPCNGHPDTAYYAKNPRGCAWFFTCNIGLPPKEGRCPEGFLFNHQKQICDFPANVECNNNENPITTCPPRGIVKIPHPDTCSKFILCFDGIEQDRYCPLGKHFSTFDNDCVTPDRSDCTTDREFCSRNRDEDVGIFPKIANPRDCSTFYICSEDNWVISNQCFNGWHFNPTTGLCQNSDTAGCDAENQQTRLDFIPTQLDFDCSNSFDGSAHPHPEDCDFWFLCVGGKSFLQKCGTDSRFDIDQNRCVNSEYAELRCSTDPFIETANNKMTKAIEFLENIGSRVKSRI